MKSNEPINLSGTLGGENLPTDWLGSTAVITIQDQITKRKVLDKAVVTLDPTTRKWTYVNNAKTLSKGKYEVEILVTFPGGGKRAFPNGYNMVLTVLEGENI